jgi:hypothetical protein
MSNTYARFCGLLAAGNFSDKELQDLLRQIGTLSPKIVIDDVYSLSKSFHRLEGDLGRRNVPPKKYYPETDDGVSSRILDLLVHDSGLSRMQAATLIFNAAKAKFPERNFPSPAKTGFEAWLNKLEKFLPQSELLHLAHLLKESVDGKTKIDWTLKD